MSEVRARMTRAVRVPLHRRHWLRGRPRHMTMRPNSGRHRNQCLRTRSRFQSSWPQAGALAWLTTSTGWHGAFALPLEVDCNAWQFQFFDQLAQFLPGCDVGEVHILNPDVAQVEKRQATWEEFTENDPL